LPGCLWEFESLPIDATLYLTRPTLELEQEVGVYFDGWQGWDEGEEKHIEDGLFVVVTIPAAIDICSMLQSRLAVSPVVRN